MNGLDPILYWSALTAAATAILVPGVSRGFAAVAAAMLVSGPILLAAAPGASAWFALPVALFLFAPGAAGLRVNAAIGAERYRTAFAWSLVRAALHPLDGAFALARYCRAMASLQHGRETQALARLRTLMNHPSMVGLLARLQLHDGANGGPLLDDPQLDEPTGAFRLRALGMAGRTDAMIDLYRALLARRPALPMSQEATRAAIVLMYAGRPRGVAALARGPRSGASPASRAFHIAYATLAAGDDGGTAALAVLREQAASDDGVARRRAASCLSEPPVAVAPLDAERAGFLDRLEAAITSLPRRRPWWRAPMSFGLIALNLAAFAVEAIAGSTTDNDALYALGALPTVHFAWPDDAWRLVTEMFLHSGPIHIGANMLSLLVLGPLVERMLGPWRFLLLYLGSGLAANVGCVLLADAGVLRAELIVGASGAIMGLVGGVAGSALRTWITTRSPLFGRRLMVVVAFLALQFAIDATIPHVSSATHLIGAGAGFLLGLLLPFRWPLPPEAFADSIEPAATSSGSIPQLRAAPAAFRRLAALLAFGSIATSLWLAFSYG